MRVTKASTERQCNVCERTLLMGELTTRYSPNGGGKYVDVCALCQEFAVDHGWVREGSPTTPMLPTPVRRRSRYSMSSLLGSRPSVAPVAPDPILRRLSPQELAIVEAADLFNASQYLRTAAGIAKSLGVPRVSVVPLSGVNQEIVITIAWEISWYQYRITPDSTQPVRLADRGHDPDDLDASYAEWNARLGEDGRVVPDIARV